MCSILKLLHTHTKIFFECAKGFAVRFCRANKKTRGTHIKHDITDFWIWDYFQCFLTKPKMWKTWELIYSGIKFMEEFVFNNIGQIFHSKKKQTKYIVWFYFSPLKVPQTCQCDTNIFEWWRGGTVSPHHATVLSPHRALGAVSSPAFSRTVWPQTHRQTCKCSSSRPHNTTDADFNMLPFCSPFKKKIQICIWFTMILIWFFFFSHRQVSSTTIELNHWEGFYSVKINKRERTVYHNKEMCTRTSTWILCCHEDS